MPDLAAIRARLAGVERLLADGQPLRGGEGPLLRWYAEDVAALLAALDAKDKALRQAKRALDAFLPTYCFPLAPEHEEEARAIANVMANVNAALDAKAQKEDDRG